MIRKNDSACFPAVFLCGVVAGTLLALYICSTDGILWHILQNGFLWLYELSRESSAGRWAYVFVRRGAEAAWFISAASRRRWFRGCVVFFFCMGTGIGLELASLTLVFGLKALGLFFKFNFPF